MPIRIIKKSFEYCTQNKLFFISILLLFFLIQILIDLLGNSIIGSIIMSLIMMGYGLEITHDIIHGGTRLPKIMPKKIISFGINGNIVFLFYTLIQGFLLSIVSTGLHFPIFELEEIFIRYNETFTLFMTHDTASFAIFIITGIIIVYITVFFMELALARLADGGKLKNAFDFKKIKRAIDIIGWRDYSIDYTKIIFSIIFLTFLKLYEIPIAAVDSAVDAVLWFLIFIIEYIGIGHIYKVYVDKKE